MKKPLILLTAFILSAAANAQTFHFSHNGWTAKIDVESCDEHSCSGAAKIVLDTGKHRQTFGSDYLYAYRKPNTPFAFNDFIDAADYNFDGKTDIAFSNGNSGPYGSSVYKIYVQTDSGRFVYSDELSNLSYENMGAPRIDKKNKLLKVSGKSGAAFHYDIHYRVRQNMRPALQMVYNRETHWTEKGIEVSETFWHNGKSKTRKKLYSEREWEAVLTRELEEMR